MRAIFNSRPQDVLKLGDELISGGEIFETDEDTFSSLREQGIPVAEAPDEQPLTVSNTPATMSASRFQTSESLAHDDEPEPVEPTEADTGEGPPDEPDAEDS